METQMKGGVNYGENAATATATAMATDQQPPDELEIKKITKIFQNFKTHEKKTFLVNFISM
jgi:hypothetical protein